MTNSTWPMFRRDNDPARGESLPAYTETSFRPTTPTGSKLASRSSGDRPSPSSTTSVLTNPWAPLEPRRVRSSLTQSPQSYKTDESFLRMSMIEPPKETIVYSYTLYSASASAQAFIMVDPDPKRQHYYTFSLSIKAALVERALCEPVSVRLTVDPRQLQFSVFMFPPRTSLPVGCLWSLRVWLQTGDVSHQLFAENDLWIARDPDFHVLADASFAVLRNADPDKTVYSAIVGSARVWFVVHWRELEKAVYACSLKYEAAGAGRPLFEDLRLRLDCEPQDVSFMIYSIPLASTPAGASHRLRVWLRTPYKGSSPSTSVLSTRESYVYQRIWKSDSFRLGAHLNFEALGRKLVMGISSEPPRTETGLVSLFTRQDCDGTMREASSPELDAEDR